MKPSTGRRGLIDGRRVMLAAGAVVLAALATGGAFGLRRLYDYRRRETRYDGIIRDAANRHHISPALVKAVIWRESRFRADAVGRDSEMGLMQIMDGAVTDWSRVTGNRKPPRGLCFDPAVNIEIGTWYLSRALGRWRGYVSAEDLALAEYNAGRTRALEWAPKEPGRELDLANVRFQSTRAYIKQVKAKYRHYENE